jgi:hypothetical protein
MKIVQGDELPFIRGLLHRGGTIHFRYLMEGDTGAPGNFSLVLAKSEGDFYSPRHRHNFDQIRFCLDGHLDFAKTGKLEPGMIGYFPEGISYGPQTQVPELTSLTLVLQFGGASGSGYLSREQVKIATEELKQQGEFKDGVYHRNEGVPGKRNMDGFQAIWEHVNQRPMVYPKPRYEHPIFMNAANYDWAAVGDVPGVAEKLLGVFTERRAEQRLLKIEAGRTYALRGPAVYVVLSGTGTAEAQPIRRFTTISTGPNDTVTVTARETIEIVQFGLPNLAGLAARSDTMAQAAE